MAVTNHGNSSLGGMADVALCSTARGSPLTGENAAARVAQLNIIDVVFVAVAQRGGKTVERNLEKTMQSVRAKRRANRR